MALMMAACTSEDLTQPQTPNSKGIPFTATISGKAATRAITENTTDGILETSWAADEQVTLIHNGVVDVMTVSKVSDDGAATITGTITGLPNDGDDVQVIYPASAVDLQTKAVKADLLTSQDGTLATIASKLDLRMSSDAKLRIGSKIATFDGTVSLKNQLAIVKFSLSDGSDVLATENLEILDGTDQTMITVKPSTAASVLYVAMPPATAQAFHFIAKKGNEEYFYSKSGVTLSAGYYYQSSVELHPKIKYIEASWNSTDHKVDLNEKTLSDASQYTLVTSSTTDVTWPAGTYVVGGNKTITGDITLTGDVDLILRDGAELTVNGRIVGGDKSLNIYGQEAGTGKLTIDGNAGTGALNNIIVQNLQIHGGDITGTNSNWAITTNGTFKIFHGTVSATAHVYGLVTYKDLSIYGGTITALTNASSAAKYAVYVYNAAMEMTGGSLTATATGADNHGIFVGKNINISGGTVNATGGSSTSGPGGHGIGNNDGDITISGTANVTATGGAGTGGNDGVGIRAVNFLEIGDTSNPLSNPTVHATGANMGMYGNGIRFRSGNVIATSTSDDSSAIYSINAIYYHGGTVKGEGGPNGKGFSNKPWNKKGSTVTFGYSEDNINWNGVNVSADDQYSGTIERYMRIPKP